MVEVEPVQSSCGEKWAGHTQPCRHCRFVSKVKNHCHFKPHCYAATKAVSFLLISRKGIFLLPLSFFFSSVNSTGIWIQGLSLLDKHSTTWHRPPVLSAFSFCCCFQIGSYAFPWAGHGLQSSYICFRVARIIGMHHHKLVCWILVGLFSFWHWFGNWFCN